jgi:hypothetical protein
MTTGGLFGPQESHTDLDYSVLRRAVHFSENSEEFRL